ncbi:hypothetical protein CFP56_003917, partial [Quercus suber]
FCGDLDSESLRRSLQGNLGEEEEEDENDVAPLSSNEKSITIAPPTSPTFPSLPPSGDDDDADFSSLRLCSGGFAVNFVGHIDELLWIATSTVIRDVKLENVEHDVGGPIKNLKFYLEDISKVGVESPNDFFPIKQVQPKLGALMKDALKLKLKFPLWRPKKRFYKF